MPRAAPPNMVKAIVCPECDRAFDRKHELNRHMMTHSSDVDALKMPCPYEGCSYRTLQKSNVKTHIIARHLKLRPQKCTIGDCESAFADGASLIRHEKAKHKFFRKANGKPKASSKPIHKMAKKSEQHEFLSMSFSDTVSVCSTPSLSSSSSSFSSPSPAPTEYFPLTPSAYSPGPSPASLFEPKPQDDEALYLATCFPELYPELVQFPAAPEFVEGYLSSSVSDPSFAPSQNWNIPPFSSIANDTSVPSTPNYAPHRWNETLPGFSHSQSSHYNEMQHMQMASSLNLPSEIFHGPASMYDPSWYSALGLSNL
ncbi:hypothetical protein DFH11DRAFT_1747348 [Phellopilus nigrolimitatus]|nr:hypothetical protein DFH11DRAFT_1747348 [Phellopilus nigrolimitatus]